jgi:hypothetical protein
VEEPQLRQDQRRRKQRRRDCSERRRNQWNERDEPDGVLRGEKAGEDQEAGDRRSRRGHESLRAEGATGEEPRDEQNSADLNDPCGHGDRIRERAGEIAGKGERGAADDLGVVRAELVRGEEHRAPEALDLQRALGLCLSAAPETVPADERKRAHHRDHDTAERQERSAELTQANRNAKERQQRRRVHLGGDGEP